MSIDFEKHKKLIEEDPNRVKCAHCGSWVPAHAEQCRKCGVHFKGEAFQFAHSSDELESERMSRARRIRVIAIAIGLLFAIGVILFFVR